MLLRDQRVLVTGGTGLIGSNLIKELLSEKAIVRATLHTRQPVFLDDRIEYVKCDLRQAEDCRTIVEGMRYVFHCAAITSGAAATAITPRFMLPRTF